MPLEIATVVQHVDAATREITVSVDSADEADRDMTVKAADELDLESLRNDEALIATLTPREGEVPLLTGWADDTGRRAADDSERAEGDQAPQRFTAE